MHAVQERSPRLTVLVEIVHLMVVHHGAIVMKSILPRRIDHGDRYDFVIGDMNAAEAALGNGCGTGQRRHTDPDDSEKTCGGILDGLLHVLAEMSHLGRSGVRAEKWLRIRCSMSQTDCGDISGGHHEFIRIGSGYEIYINEERRTPNGGYIPLAIPVPARRRKYRPINIVVWRSLREDNGARVKDPRGRLWGFTGLRGQVVCINQQSRVPLMPRII